MSDSILWDTALHCGGIVPATFPKPCYMYKDKISLAWVCHGNVKGEPCAAETWKLIPHLKEANKYKRVLTTVLLVISEHNWRDGHEPPFLGLLLRRSNH